MIKLKTEVAGLYKIEAVKADGSRRLLADWFPNLITNNGLNLIGNSSSWLNSCQVGSGSTTPNVNDTSLASRIAGTSTRQTSVSGNQPTAPYFAWRRNTYRFAEGVATGNIAEVGIGPGTTGNLFSRALILDSFGNPTTVSVASDESLDVTYEVRYYAPTTDNTFDLTIAGVTYSVVARAANVTSGLSWVISAIGTGSEADSTALAFNGTIGAITGQPAGSSSGAGTKTNAAYSADTYRRDATLTWALNEGNLAGGITALLVRHGVGSYQLGFTPAIPKDATKVLAMTVRQSWARR